jgi:hypothetical protein
MFSLTLMSKGEKRSGLDAIVGGPNILVHLLRVSINAKGEECWHVYRKSVLVIDVKKNNDDGIFTCKKNINEGNKNDAKQGKHKFRRRSEQYENQISGGIE